MLTARERRLATNLLAAAACLLAVWWVFVLGQAVPILYFVDLTIHEVGHLMFSWVPGIAGPLAGSIAQVGVPLALVLYFGIVRREAYSTALMLAWLGTSAQHVTVYVVDVQYRVLPFITNGAHDWNLIFASLGHLEWAAPAGVAVRMLGLLAVLLGLALAVAAALKAVVRPRVDARREAAQADRLASLPRREPSNRSSAAAGGAGAPRPGAWQSPHRG